MQITEIPYHLLRIWVGLYFIYWGLNGFFGWSKIPQNSARFESFIARLLSVPHLMTAVKVTEIAAGLLLLEGQNVDLSLLLLLPLVSVIVGAHLTLNFAKGWRTAAIVLIPYALLGGSRYQMVKVCVITCG